MALLGKVNKQNVARQTYAVEPVINPRYIFVSKAYSIQSVAGFIRDVCRTMVLVLCCRLPCQLPHLVGIFKKSSEVNYSKQSLIQRHPDLCGFLG